MISPEREKTGLLGDAQTAEGSQVFAPHALKGQKLLAQGIALGIMAMGKAPCKGKSFKYCQEF